jgi:hypothetical protein
MSSAHHPFVAASIKHSDANASQDDVTEGSIMQFVCLHPETRSSVLGQLDSVIQADDGSSLRQRAQLLALSRALSDTHTTMRKAGR